MATIDIASSFAQADIPVKLRCAICSKLVVNAFRLPCCDQNICGSCQSALPESCPVCAHSPLSADACQPLKALRLTVSAFIKKEEKKREKERALNNTSKPSTVALPESSAPASSTELAHDTSDQPIQSVEAASSQQEVPNTAEPTTAEGIVAGSQDPADQNQSLEQQTNETSTLSQPPDARRGSTAQPPTSAKSVERTSTGPEAQSQDPQAGVQSGQTVEGQNPGWDMNGAQGQQMYPGAYGFGANQGNYIGMDWSGASGFNPMMMPSGMNGGDWNNYQSMMGMPGMNMGPMSQGMFGGFGGQAMGMNGMAGINGMNMGMNYGGGYGNGWNGQQMSGGDFGGANTGYYPGGGYNQSSQEHFPHQMHQQQFPKNNFQNQNRFQGQGAYPQRGGFGRGHQGNFATQNQSQPFGQNQVSTGQTQMEQKHDDAANDKQASSAPQDSSVRMSVEQPQLPPSSGTDGADGAPEKPTDSEKTLGSETATGNNEIKPEGEESTNQINASGSRFEDNQTLETAALTGPAEISVDKTMNTNTDANTQQLQPIATVDTEEPSSQSFDHQNMNMGMGMGMPQDMMGQSYSGPPNAMGMMNEYPQRGRGGARGGYGRGAGYDFRGGFGGRGVQGGGFMPTGAFGGSNTPVPPQKATAVAVNYGNITVLTSGEPKGLGVEGAPTGPKAMREGRPNTGFASRGRFSGPQTSGVVHVTPDTSANGSQTRPRSKTPMRDDSLRVRSKSRSKSKSPPREKSKSRSRSRSREHRRHPDRSATPNSDFGSREKYREHRSRRSSRKYDDEREGVPEDDYNDEEKDKAKDDRSRSSSVESRYRSRRDKDKHRSSRSHRDRSREHRRHRHRSRSRSPIIDEEVDNPNDLPSESSSRRKGRSEKHKERERDRERDRDRDRGREPEHDRDRDRGKDRRRDRDRERKHSRRDRSKSPRYASDDERPHRSSRQSHKDRERERDRDYTHAHSHSHSRDHSPPPPTAPTGPSKPPAEVEFKIQGRSKARSGSSTIPPIKTNTTMPPPTAPKSTQPLFQPPKGPAAERSNDRDRDRGSRRRPSASSTPITPTTPTTPAVDPHTLEREARNRERMLKEAQRRASMQNPKAAFSSAEKKRGREAVDEEEDKPFEPPTGPSSQRQKRRRESEASAGRLEDRAGGKTGKGKKGRGDRRMSYKYEDEENDEARARRLERMEREREESRWN